jgi:hypothetical protein
MSKQVDHRRAFIEDFRRTLAVQIKLDIARYVRHHPTLDGKSAVLAYDTLAADTSVDSLIRELAAEEIAAAVDRGQVPPAAILHLAGYRQNPIPEG